MSALKTVSWQDIQRVLLQLGFTHKRTKGSHMVFKKPGILRAVTVPKKKEIPVGTLRSLIRNMEITPEQYQRILEGKN